MASTPSIITIGNFDGVHRGHQAILSAARELAEPRSARVLALTFDPMPVTVLRPGTGPPHLGTIRQRIDALKQAGADEVIVLEPTPEVLSQEAPRFISQLIEAHNAVGFVEGDDFRFGKKRGGNMKLLSEMGKQQGFEVRALPRVEVPLSDQSVAPISSSLVRWLVGRGRVEDAGSCMGRAFELRGEVVKGEQRGRSIGVPTANLDPACYDALITPMDGVYAGYAWIEDPSDAEPDQIHPAAISVGVKPTFGKDLLTIEAHLVDYNAEHPDVLYGKTLRVGFARWVRDQYPFPGIDELKQQLKRDIDTTRDWMSQPPVPAGYD